MSAGKSHFTKDRIFTRKEVELLLNAAKGRTLGEVDRCGLLQQAFLARNDKVVRGIAGDIIEASVLGVSLDNKRKPDVLIDGEAIEVKTTGVKRLKKGGYVAKEPITITDVSPKIIINEEFYNSSFYHKIEHLLFVFYLYSLAGTAKNSMDYAAFPILNFDFWKVPQNELEVLKNDWLLVKQFSQKHRFEEEDARHQLKANLMLIDYASPKQPRFRFKKSYATTIVDALLNKGGTVSLPTAITKFSEIDEKCRQFTHLYRGRTIAEICHSLNLSLGNYSKDTCQRIIVKMFGSDAKSINQVRDFNAIGLTAKTIVLTSTGKRTEDTKLFSVDFNDFLRKDISFGEKIDSRDEPGDYSYMYSYFAEQSFIFIVFEEPYEGKNIPLTKCRFRGFKRFSFDEGFILNDVYNTWNDARNLVFKKELKEVRSGGGYAPNFPKSKQYNVFFRGSGIDGTDKKPLLHNWGIPFSMYSQWVWIRGDYIVNKLNEIPYL